MISRLKNTGASPSEISNAIMRKNIQVNERYGNRSTVGYLIDMQDSTQKQTMSITTPGDPVIKPLPGGPVDKNIRIMKNT